MRLIIEDVRHLKLKENMLWIGTTTLVTVVIWIVYAIYVAYNKPTIDDSVQALLKPLNPSLDQTALSLLDDPFYPPDTFTVNIEPSEQSAHFNALQTIVAPANLSSATGSGNPVAPPPTSPPNF